MIKGLLMTLCVGMALATPVRAQDTRISEDRGSFQVTLNGVLVDINRNGAPCPPSCIQPISAGPGIATIGELEVMTFLDLFVAPGAGLLIDARLPEGYAGGSVPGAVNVPAATLRPDNPYRDDLLSALGVRSGDFSGAFDLVLFGRGADDGDPADALRALLQAGYPANKLKYYRGGITAWQALGLTTATGR